MNIWWFGFALFLTGGGVWLKFYQTRRRAIEKIRAETNLVQTARGPVEYSSLGQGIPVLVVHGWGGGQGGYNLFHFLAGHGFQVISVSRPGYMGTPLKVGRTMEEQADMLAALLDTLGIRKVAILTGSGGGPASILFALRHPERCWGLVLVCALLKPDPITGKSAGQKMLEKVFTHDFWMWVLTRLFWRALVEDGMGNLSESIRHDPVKMDILKQLIMGLILGSLSVDGLKNDMMQWEQMPVYPLERITAPALIINSRNDKSIPWHIAEFAMTIPNSQHLHFDDGGHTCYIVYSEITHPATVEFLSKHRPVHQPPDRK